MTLPVRPSSGPVLSTPGHQTLAPPNATQLLHGAVLRPARMQWNGQHYTGQTTVQIKTGSASQVPGVVAVVSQRNFIGVVASQPGQARHARARIHVEWASPSPLNKSAHTPNVPETKETKTYRWQSSTLQPAEAIALLTQRGLTLWCDTQHTNALQRELSALLDLSPEKIQILPNGQRHLKSYDTAVDAALLCTHTPERPVKVVQENTEPEEVSVSISRNLNTQNETLSQYPFRRPSIAALLCGAEHRFPSAALGDRQQYQFNIQQTVLPQNAGLPHTPEGDISAAQIFARESFFDEYCREHHIDPVQARLDQLQHDTTGRHLVDSVAKRAQWYLNQDKKEPGKGKGFAYGRIIDNEQEPPRQVWSAWVAQVSVSNEGHVDVTHLTVGHSTEAINEVDQSREIETSVRQTAQNLLRSPESFDSWGKISEETSFPLVQPDVTLVPQNQQGAVATNVSWNEKAQWPAAAAIANAIHDATGVRLREAPFDNQQLQRAVTQKPASSNYKKWAYGLLGGIAATAAGLVVSAMPWRGAIAPVAVDTRIYSSEAIERGRLVSIAGDCMVCHTAEGGVENTGGRPLDTPFGVVYSTNITPDPTTGIGGWSYEAFERTMREGIHQDGRHLYPVFPYTAFAKISEADMQSLYAYLMTREPVQYTPQKTELAFPYNARSLMAGWNTLFHQNERFQPDPTQSTLWNRGAYLVQGAGHCTACHTPRNALGAEKSGDNNYLAGGFAEGWEAPALNSASKAPIAWTEASLFEYLRTGFSSLHGVASGPMAPVVEGLSQLPESDVRAMAHYLSALTPESSAAEPAALTAARLEDASKSNQAVMTLPGESLFEGACAVCHDAREGPPLFGSRPSLALNSNLHSEHPDNVIQVLMHGIADPTQLGLGDMPGFKDSLNNQQMKNLLEYMRARFAPDKASWQGLDEKIESIRSQTVR